MNEEATALLTVENAMEQSASIFEGHPAEIEPDESIEKDEKSGEKLDEKPEIKPDEKLDEKPELEKKPAFEYVSQEAAEKGVKETKTLMHKKAEEAKRERERAEDLQKQLNDALLKVTKSEPEPVKTSADRMKVLLDQVNALDPEDQDYHAKVAAIWGRREDEMQGNIDAKVKEALDTYDKKLKDEQARVNDEHFIQKKIMSDAESAGKESGLDMKKGSDDSEMFWAFADRAPEGTIEDQIKWTVDKVKGIKDGIAAPLLKAGNKAAVTQEQNAVLERHGPGKPAEKAAPIIPLGLGEAFTQIQRRI